MSDKRRAVTIVLAVVALAPVGYFSFLKLNRSIEEGLVKHKLVRETTGIVVSKNRLLFDESNKSYIDDEGRPIEKRPGEEEWRVYYLIDNLDPIDEHTRTLLMAAEKKRREEGGPRFTVVIRGRVVPTIADSSWCEISFSMRTLRGSLLPSLTLPRHASQTVVFL